MDNSGKEHSRQEEEKGPSLWNGDDFECAVTSKITRMAQEPSE